VDICGITTMKSTILLMHDNSKEKFRNKKESTMRNQTSYTYYMAEIWKIG
jgi:hypothetical protein